MKKDLFRLRAFRLYFFLLFPNIFSGTRYPKLYNNVPISAQLSMQMQGHRKAVTTEKKKKKLEEQKKLTWTIG